MDTGTYPGCSISASPDRNQVHLDSVHEMFGHLPSAFAISAQTLEKDIVYVVRSRAEMLSVFGFRSSVRGFVDWETLSHNRKLKTENRKLKNILRRAYHSDCNTKQS